MKREFSFLTLLFILLFWSNQALAENTYGIPDDLYQVYDLANQAKDPERQLALADSMYVLAEKKHNTKAECLAVIIRMRYYYNQHDKDNLYETIDRVMDLAEKCNEDHYYFYAWALKGNFLKNKGEFYDAMQVATLMKQKAEEKKSDYGLYSTLRLLANIHENRNEFLLAIKNYEEAMTFAANADEETSPLLYSMAWCYLNMNQPEKAVECYQKSMEVATSERTQKATQVQLCFALFRWNAYQSFEKNYQEIMTYFENGGNVQKRYLPRLKALHYIINGDFANAQRQTLEMDNAAEALALEIEIYKAQGNYRLALEKTDRLKSMNDSLMLTQHSHHLAELDAAIGNTSLKLKTEQLMQNHLKMQNTMLFMGLGFGLLILLLLAYFLTKSRKLNTLLNFKNQELDLARAKAQESDNLKTHFIQHVTHEFRTPLNAIVGFSQILAEEGNGLDEDTRSEFVNDILNSSNQLTLIVNNMLDISMLSSNSIALVPSDIQVDALCQEIISENIENNPEGVELRYESHIPANYSINSDPQRITQILQNFISNSQKSTIQGQIVLSTQLQQNHLFFYVTDTGCGIPEEQMDNIFEMFKKVDEFKQGLGIGLTICKMMALKLGGQVNIDRSYKGGARFWFELG